MMGGARRDRLLSFAYLIPEDLSRSASDNARDRARDSGPSGAAPFYFSFCSEVPYNCRERN